MRVVLVHPAGSNWIAGGRDLAATANRMAPLGLLSIAAYLEREGHEVFVHDGLGPRALSGTARNVDQILSLDPEIVGFSATTSGFLDGWEMARAIKALRPSVRTFFGGVHVSALGAALLDRFDGIDGLCPGEGEATLAALAAGEAPAMVEGLIWREGERIVVNAPRPPLPDLDALPFPAYEKLAGFPEGYHLPLFSYERVPGATLVTSRGCPYRCSYCDRSVFGRSYRVNSAAYIYEHLRHLRRRFGVRHVNIYDDLFTADRQRIAELCERLAARPLGLQFNCAVRAGHTDWELLAMLKDAGCLMVSLGVESGDAAMLERHKAGVTLEAVRGTVGQIRAAGLRVKGLFMIGLPGETDASIRRTGDFLLSLDLDDMNLAKFTPFPGAPLWETIRDEGRFEEDWRRMNCLNFVFVPRGIASRERLDRLYNEQVKRFYTSPAWRRRFRSRLWAHRHSLWHMARHLPSFLSARRQFEPKAEDGRREDGATA